MIEIKPSDNQEYLVRNPINLNEREISRIERVGFGYAPLKEVYEYEESLSELKSFEESHKKKKLIVQEVLEGWNPATNNDSLLYWECLRTEFPEIKVTRGKDNDIIFRIPLRIIKLLTSPESYTRARRSLNSKGLCLPTDTLVLEKRKKREVAIRKYFKGGKDGRT